MLCYCPSCFRKIYGDERRITKMSDQVFQCPECMHIGHVVMGSELTDYGRRAADARWERYQNEQWEYRQRQLEFEREERLKEEAAAFFSFGL